jgi:hypothetical protein
VNCGRLEFAHHNSLQMAKPEIRGPKGGRNPKSENNPDSWINSDFGFRPSFGPRSFGLRIFVEELP